MFCAIFEEFKNDPTCLRTSYGRRCLRQRWSATGVGRALRRVAAFIGKQISGHFPYDSARRVKRLRTKSRRKPLARTGETKQNTPIVERIFDMALLAQDELDAFRRRNAYEFREHERIIRAMRRENIHMLYTERPKGAEDCRMRNLLRDTLGVVGSDTEEHVGSEPLNVGYYDRGTGAMPPPVLEEPAVDEYNDESGMASKEALPKGTGQKLGGETRIRSTRSGAENETDVDVN